MDGFEAQAICCAYAPAPGVRLEPAAVRQRLTSLVPSYMLPTRWLVLERLPKNVNGKIDRARLKELFSERRERVGGFGRAASSGRDIGPAS